jgi:hypothetical protein
LLSRHFDFKQHEKIADYLSASLWPLAFLPGSFIYNQAVNRALSFCTLTRKLIQADKGSNYLVPDNRFLQKAGT